MAFPPSQWLKHCGFSPLHGYTAHQSCGSVHHHVQIDDTKVNKSSWSHVTSVSYITLVLHSICIYIPHGWCVPDALDLFSVIRSAPSIQYYVSWSIVQGEMKSSWSRTVALATCYPGDFTGVMCAIVVDINTSGKLHKKQEPWKQSFCTYHGSMNVNNSIVLIHCPHSSAFCIVFWILLHDRTCVQSITRFFMVKLSHFFLLNADICNKLNIFTHPLMDLFPETVGAVLLWVGDKCPNELGNVSNHNSVISSLVKSTQDMRFFFLSIIRNAKAANVRSILPHKFTSTFIISVFC